MRAAEILDLTHLLDRYPRSSPAASASVSRWVGPSCATREVFLFDEPLSNLDAKLRVQMRTEIKALHQRLKTTIVFVTHDQIEAMTMADRIVVMNKGHRASRRAARALRPAGQPLRRRVHRLAGDEPDRRASPRAGGVEAEGGAAAGRRRRGRREGRPVVYGIRPEHLELADDGLRGARCGWSSRPGRRRSPTCSCGAADVVAVFRDRHDLAPGQQVHLRPRADKAHLFDPESGRRL